MVTKKRVTSSLGEERRQFILSHLEREGAVSVAMLSQSLGVSAATLRRDLARLDRQGLARRTHGGALLRHEDQGEIEPSPQDKEIRCAEEKRAIAREAARLVTPGTILLFNGGTTTTQVARTVRSITPLRVVTNSVSVAVELAGERGIDVTLTGGTLRGSLEMYGPIADQSLQGLYGQIAFIGIDGLTLHHGLTTYDPLEAQTNRLMLSHAQRVVVVADHTKIGRVTMAVITPCQSIHTLITDPAADPQELDALRQAGIEVIIAPL